MTSNDQQAVRARSELLKLSLDMLALADEGDWQKALATQRVRHAKIVQFFDGDLSCEQPADLALTIRELMAIDAEMTRKLKAQQLLMEADLLGARRNYRAAGSYMRNSAIY